VTVRYWRQFEVPQKASIPLSNPTDRIQDNSRAARRVSR